MIDQHNVDITTYFLSWGWNKSLNGLKWEPFFPGLLLICITKLAQKTKIKRIIIANIEQQKYEKTIRKLLPGI